MEIRGNDILGSNIIGEVKCQSIYPDMGLVKEIEEIMNRYKVDYMWFGWNKFGASSNTKPHEQTKIGGLD